MTLTLVAPYSADTLIDNALVHAAGLIDCRDAQTVHDSILGLVDCGIFWGRLGSRTVAALYAASLNSGDWLCRLLGDVQTRAHNATNRDHREEHEDAGPCRAGDLDRCPVCVDVSAEWLADALRELRGMLGDAVLADLRSAT